VAKAKAVLSQYRQKAVNCTGLAVLATTPADNLHYRQQAKLWLAVGESYEKHRTRKK